MDVYFLSASKPITKSYALSPQNEVVVQPYPFVYEVTSHEYSPVSLRALYSLIVNHAAQGHCLLKGKLGRQLVAESRKGSTDPDAKTDWICLDLDGVHCQTVDLFLQSIGCNGVDYILQWSSSMGIENKTGFRCHVFMCLDKPTHPQILKHWLMGLNLNAQLLSTQLELTKTGNSLRWPLDITTCQNDKPLYIAPPILGPGIKDPFVKTRITYKARGKQLLSIPYPVPTRETLQQQIDIRINELRVLNGLPKRKATKYKFNGSVEYMANPSTAVVTESKTERGFVYFNLNGGDSWAYYHPEDSPDFIYNFKGEPAYRTQDLLPEYWAKLQHAAATSAPAADGRIYLAFRDFKSGNYYNGYYDTKTNKLELPMAKSENQLRQFMKQHGQVIGECILDWEITWDPNSQKTVDPDAKTVNTYQPSTYLLNTNPKKVKAIPPTIYKVIHHVLGNDTPTTERFINWLACVVAYKTNIGTAWVLQGIPGTGKGVLFNKILTPLFGEQNVVPKRMEEIESEFTGYMENKFVVFVDEFETGKSAYHDKIAAKLKTLIVEPTISVRRMYHPPYVTKNYTNMIFSSNKTAPVEIAPGDRRFNVGIFQKTQLDISEYEVDTLLPAEISDFYGYLFHYSADRALARTPLFSAARDQLIDINRTAIDTVTDALLAGDLQFFWDHLSTEDKGQNLNALQMYRYTPYRDLVVYLVQNQPNKLTRDELYTLTEWCIGGMPQSPNKFTALLKHHQIHLVQVWKNNRNVRGIEVTWKIDPTWLTQAQLEIANGVI